MTRMLYRVFAALVAVTSLLACGGGGGGGGGATPASPYVVATRGTAPFGDGSYYYCPDALDFLVLLAPDGIGWVSLEHAAIGANVVEVSWEETGNTITIIAPPVEVWGLFQPDPYYYVQLGWTDLTIEVRDLDGDGVEESGSASITLTCEWEEALWPEKAEVDVDFEIDADSTTPILTFGEDRGLQPIYTFRDPFFVTASHPLSTASLGANVGLIIDGQRVDAVVTPEGIAGPLATALRIDPVAPVPFGAVVELDPGTATDAMGNAAEFDGNVVNTIDDPGPLTDNPGFETSKGWLGLNTSAYTNEYFYPFEGLRYATVANDSPYSGSPTPLVGYVDVPNDATMLSFEASIYNYLDDCSYTDIQIVTSIGGYGLFPYGTGPLPCDFCIGSFIPWTLVPFDLESFRGQRVVFEAHPSTYTECYPDQFEELLLDDFRIE